MFGLWTRYRNVYCERSVVPCVTDNVKNANVLSVTVGEFYKLSQNYIVSQFNVMDYGWLGGTMVQLCIDLSPPLNRQGIYHPAAWV